MLALFSLLGLPGHPLSVEEAKEVLDREGFVPKSGPTGAEVPEPGGAPLIATEDLHSSYTPKVPVLRDISLEIRQGDFVCLLGQNGSGKTTLVMHFNAFLQPGSGVSYSRGLLLRRSVQQEWAGGLASYFKTRTKCFLRQMYSKKWPSVYATTGYLRRTFPRRSLLP
jgi:ABC-type multidrug transport system fused ATPase/permease subunit